MASNSITSNSHAFDSFAIRGPALEMMKTLSAPNLLTNSRIDSIALGTSVSRVVNHSSEVLLLPGKYLEITPPMSIAILGG